MSLIDHVQVITEGHALFVEQLFTLWEESDVTNSTPTVDGQIGWNTTRGKDLSTVAALTLGGVLDERVRRMEADCARC